ncbi:MAG: hypothetical protein ABW321_15815 [Polyangiales bacterium]
MMLSRYRNARTFSTTSAVLGLAFLIGGVAHALGWMHIGTLDNEPRVFVSSGVEVLCGVLLLGAAFVLRSAQPNGWRNAIGAHALALVCLLLGMVMFSAALGVSLFGVGFHLVMLLLVGLNTVGLWRLRPRNPLRRAQHEIAARLY